MNSNLRSLSRSFMNGIKSAESGATTLSTDKNVLYIMLIIAVVNVLGYLMMGNFEAVVFFVIVAYLSTFFTNICPPFTNTDYYTCSILGP